MNSPPPRLVRWMILSPLAWLGSLGLTLIAPAFMILALGLDLIERRSWRNIRLVVLGASFCAFEFLALTRALGVGARSVFGETTDSAAAHGAVFRWWLARVTSTMRRCLNFRFEIRFPETGDAPLLVLSRHAGPGDALFLMNELANKQGRQIRAIGKGKLLWDPFFDHVATRAGFIFLPPGHPDPGRAIRSRAAMPPRGAFISFPEGGNYTTSRRTRAVERLERSGRTGLAETAAGLDRLLLPRPGGVAAAMAGAPDAEIVFVGHSGYDDLRTVKDMWTAIPEGRTIRLEARLVERPVDWQDREVLTTWLFQCWSDMNRWIAKHTPPR